MKNKELKLVISAGSGYCTAGLAERGILVFRPYKDRLFLGRVLRELWFKMHLPEKVWYNKKIINLNPGTIYVRDCLITVSYLRWLQTRFPYTCICYDYSNLIGKAKHLLPSQVPSGIYIRTYDIADSQKYNIILTSGGEFPACYLRKRLPIEYDVFYIGADKGRADYIMELKEIMEKMGLKTKVIITKESRMSKNKKIYSHRIPYEKVLEYDCRSKAILNIIVPGQESATLRDYEALFLKSKLITNNSNAKYFDFYRKENVFILGEDDISLLPQFVESDFVDIDEAILKKHLR